MAALRTTRRSSDLSKHSAEVFAEAEDHPVTVTRRDGESLVLMSQREADSRNRMLEFAAQLIGMAVDDNGPLAERIFRGLSLDARTVTRRPGHLRPGPRRRRAGVVLH